MKKWMVAGVLLLVHIGVDAYERATHQRLSTEAARASVLANPDMLYKLGLVAIEVDDDGGNVFNTSEGARKSILELIKFGADWEDGRGLKVQATRHFFNPVTKDALSVGPYILTTPPFFVPKFTGIRSPDWALEDVSYDPGSLGLPQRFSLMRYL